jgi:hypothetical protein
MPHFCMLTPNPVDDDHWISRQFPTDNSREGHRYLKTSVYDNRAALGDAYIAQLELSYQEGHPLRRRYVDGERGVSVIGTPVYKGYFRRGDHILPVEYDPTLPLLEGWDFGHHHPAVTWVQFQRGGAVLAILGGVQGESLFLETFAPHVLRIRQEWFPGSAPLSMEERRANAELERARRYFPSFASEPEPARGPHVSVDSLGDPSGGYHNSQGTSLSAESVLADFGVAVRSQSDANHPERRNFAIQTVAGYMQRALADGTPCFQVNGERFLMVSQERGIYSKPALVDGFEAGYVWDELSIARTASPNTRRPKKNFPGDVYSHNQNGVEYVVLAAAPAAPASLAGQFMTDEARLRAGAVQLRDHNRQIRVNQKDTVEIEHQRMMRTLRAWQPGGRALRSRAGGFEPSGTGTGPRGGY